MNASAFSKHLDLAILRSREALAVAEEIEAAPSKLVALQSELVRVNAQLTSARSTLAAERASWQIEWKKLKDRSDQDHIGRQRAEADLLAMLDEAKATLAATQNKIASVRLRVEKIASLFRKLERMRAHPSSGAPGMSATISELVELAR
jgi:hypothetical protein